MDDASSNRGGVDSHRKLVAFIIIILVGFGLIYLVLPRVAPFLPLPDEDPSYSMTVWISPEEEEFNLFLDFFASEQDAGSWENRYCGYSIRVAPMDAERNDCYLHGVPENLLSVWVKIYFNQDTEDPHLLINLDIGNRITVTLEEREVSILIEPWSGGEG